jgi:F0F1-type ATP synthase alpha subunit
MEIKADEITAILKQQLTDYEKTIDVAEVGTVLSVGDGIARIYGLDKVMAGELVDFGHDIFGLALNLEQDQVGVVLLGESQMVKEGQEVRRTRRPRSADRRQGAGQVDRVLPDRAHRSRRDRPAGRQGTRPDGPEGDRRDDPDRARPARAHHRRPADG